MGYTLYMIKTNRPVMTYAIAMSAGRDVANARMRKAGRTSWNKADYNVAAREFARLMKGR